MTNQEVAELLEKIAAVYTIKEDNRFKIIAYENAADSIKNSVVEVKDLWKDGKLSTLPGIGKSIAGYLDELFRTGRVKHFEIVLRGVPASIFPLLEIPGFGPKKAYKIVSLLKLNNPEKVIDELLQAARGGKIAPIEGFGDKSQQDIIEAIERFKRGQGREKRMPLPYAYNLADEVIDYLNKHKDTLDAVPLGSLRRMLATIGDIDIAVATNNPKETIKWFLAYPKKEKVVEEGGSGATILLDSGRQIDLRVQSPKKFGAMLQYFTGSKAHNIHLREYALKKGLSLSEYGIKPLKKNQELILRLRSGQGIKKTEFNKKEGLYEIEKEEDFYKALGLAWMPPEIREDRGEIEAALCEAQGKLPGLPKLVETSDIKGEFHIHSNYDLKPSHDLGQSSLVQLVKQAETMHYEYIGISDHNPSYTNHNSSEILSILKARKSKFEQILKSIKSVRVHLFIMLEVDILPDGKLPLPDAAFDFLDAIIVSVHSSFRLPKTEMTDRIISGLSYPKAKILGHPTGRLFGTRDGYELDWERIFKYCQQMNKALEINSFPERLDLSDTLVKEAIKNKVKLAINTDSHEVSQMNMLKYGVSVARRGWAEKDDIINTMPYNKVKEWLFSSGRR
jgi:DNA polymerase (family 10)